MAPNKTSLPKHANAGTFSLNGKTITDVDVYSHGTNVVIAVNYAGGPTYIKVNGTQVEVGGTDDFGTGTKLF